MAISTYEGFVEHGQIHLKDHVELPEKARVYVIVPDLVERPIRFPSPRLIHPEQASHFVMDMVEDKSDAGV